MEQILEILRELGNYGFGVWGIVLFFRMRRLKKAELTRDTVAVYQKIAESNNKILSSQNEELISVKEELIDLRRIVLRIEECKSYPVCPARPVVQDYKRKYFHAPRRQPSMEQKGFRLPRDNPVEPGPIDDPG